MNLDAISAPAHPDGHAGFRHLAFLYRGQAEFLAGLTAFARAALARGEPVLAAVPGSRPRALCAALGEDAGLVTFADKAEFGRNPGRIIPAVHAFARGYPGRRVSFIGETAWAGRSAAGLREAVRHEALCNLAFAGLPMDSLCAFDVAGLPAGVVAAARQTHPLLAQPSGVRGSPAYLGPEGMPGSCLEPLPQPPADAVALRYRDELSLVRALVGRQAARGGLPADRVTDLVLAASELAANTLRHTRQPGTLRVWQAAGELVCEISDRGWIADPLAGRHPCCGDEDGGHGLWLVHQVCDLVETRTGPAGTAIRLHMQLPEPPDRRRSTP